MAFFVGRKSRTTNHFTITKHNSYIHMCCFKRNEKQQNIATVLWVTVCSVSQLSIAISFGDLSWLISLTDLDHAHVFTSSCLSNVSTGWSLGTIFDITQRLVGSS